MIFNQLFGWKISDVGSLGILLLFIYIAIYIYIEREREFELNEYNKEGRLKKEDSESGFCLLPQ